jgi:hypothetical protein
MARKAKEPKKPGRPSKFTPEIAAEICSRMANGETLRDICLDEHMPHRTTVSDWVLADEEFSRQYARARELQADFWGDECMEIADDGTNDWMQKKSGDTTVTVVNHEHIQRSKVRIEQRQWMMERLNAKIYGRKQELKHDASDAFLNLWQKIGGGT